MPEKPITIKKKRKTVKKAKAKLTAKDMEILAVAAENPGISNAAIGRQVHGVKQYIYKRLNENQMLSDALDAIKANNLEYMTRVIGPLAMKKLADMLDDDDQKPGIKVRLIETGLKYTPELKELEQKPPPVMIPVKEMQIHIQNLLIRQDGDA